MDRPYFEHSVTQLEKLVAEYRSEPAVLGQVWQELTYRESTRSKQLMREVLGLLDGRIPEPKRAGGSTGASDQFDLL